MKLRNSAIIIFAFLGFFLFAPSADAAVEYSSSSLRVLFHFEDTTDSSGNGRNLTVGAGGAFATTSGLLSGYWDSVSAVGANNYLTFASSGISLSAGAMSGNFTMAWWMHHQSFSTGFYFTSGAQGRGILVADNKACVNSLDIKIQGDCQPSTVTDPSLDAWHWYVLRRYSGHVTLFRDNAAIKDWAAASTTNNINGVLRFNGAVDDTDGQDFWIDEFAFIDEAISSSTMSELYNSGAGDEICTTGGCAGSPQFSMSPASFSFTSTNTSGTEIISNVGVGTLNWTVTSSQSWLTFSTNSGAVAAGASGTTKFITSLWGYASGTYNATATFSDPAATNTPQTVSVTAEVGGGGSSGGGGTRVYWIMSILRKLMIVPRHYLENV